MLPVITLLFEFVSHWQLRNQKEMTMIFDNQMKTTPLIQLLSFSSQ